jgi:methyltransferase family protein
MEHKVLTVLAEVVRIAPTLHKAGTFSAGALEAIVRHATARPVQHSVETGSGASTLLFSHVSADHTVFAVDAGTGSIRSIETSPLLRREAVTFVEGPTQVTLPRHTFAHRLQLVLIDGPHGYPFPDLEYYHVYPHLDPDALLIVDDIHIPTITNLFDFISADEMFDLQEVVETTAFFRRTDAPTFPTTGDGWWTQQYNKSAFEGTEAELLNLTPPERVELPALFYLDQFGPVQQPLGVSHMRVPLNEHMVVAGWALDARRRRPAVAVDLVLDGATYRASVGICRADVAAAYGDPAYVRSGFRARFPPGAVSAGPHKLEIRVVVAGGREYYPAARIRFEGVQQEA